ncbi:MAG: hypothetical protein J0M15_08300 [Deltaproteobacteria bacterium]|nr:hypothetical protein [Deltaproteobacteria bacterium]
MEVRLTSEESVGISQEDKKILAREVLFKTFIISGPGGQNLHKSSTGAEMTWDLEGSFISEALRKKILEGIDRNQLSLKFQFKSQGSRSLGQNKKDAFSKFMNFLEKIIFVPKKRRLTKPTYSSKIKKIEGKKKRGEVKKNRRKINFE